MSDGGEESKRDSEYIVGDRAGPNDYGRAVARVAVAQVCESVGFECFKESALEALSDVAVRFMCDLGKSASSYASLASRAECNVFDIVKALEDLGSTIGFSGASEVSSHCPVGSGVANEMIEFVEMAEEIPFVQPIPRFPVIKRRKGIPSFLQIGESPGGNKHIPDWLPAFPDTHTYIHSPVWNDRKTDPQADKLEQVRQRRKAEKSLLNLQQRLLSSSAAGPSGSQNHHHHADVPWEYSASQADAAVAVEKKNHETFLVQPPLHDNPFLAPPLPAGEKDVSSIVSPIRLKRKEDDDDNKKHSSMLEIFAPAIDAMKSGVTESERRDLPDKRPVVHFRLKEGGRSRQMMGEDLDTCLADRVNHKNSFSFMRDDEKDDKKRRAEMILRQSMENSQELT
ncbi:hypothetical protein Dimus_007135 [Dionaea muscipula]